MLPDTDENPVRIFTPVDASACPTVGANCRRNVTADAIGVAKVRGRHEGEKCRWCRNRVEHMHGEGHHDVPRFGALRRDNTPTPACLFYINALWNYNDAAGSTRGKVSAAAVGCALLRPRGVMASSK